MKPILALTLALAAATALSACGDREAQPELATRMAALQAGMDTDTMMVDGTPTPITFHEFKGGDTFPAQFQVRYPEGMAVTARRSAMGEVVQLTQAADTSAGLWRLTFLPAGTAEDAARATAMGVAETFDAATTDSTASGLLAQTGPTSRVWLTQHAGRYIVVQSSADGAAAWAAFAPRAVFVDQHWTWADGSVLGS